MRNVVKINNKDNKTTSVTSFCSFCQLLTHFIPFLLFLLLTLNKSMFAGIRNFFCSQFFRIQSVRGIYVEENSVFGWASHSDYFIQSVPVWRRQVSFGQKFADFCRISYTWKMFEVTLLGVQRLWASFTPRSSCPKVFFKKVVLKNSIKVHMKTPSSIHLKAAGLQYY